MISTILVLSLVLASVNMVESSTGGVMVTYSDTSCSTPLYASFASSMETCEAISCTSSATVACTNDWDSYCKSVFPKGSTYILIADYHSEECTEEPDGLAFKVGVCTKIAFDSSLRATVATDGSVTIKSYDDAFCGRIDNIQTEDAASVSSHECVDKSKFYVGNGTASSSSTTSATTTTATTSKSASPTRPGTSRTLAALTLALTLAGGMLAAL